MAKPVVDGIERALEGKAQVLRLSVTDDVGSQLAVRYGARGVPTLVVLDGAGDVVYVHLGQPNREDILDAVEGALE
jgi:hypothetical protein